MKENCVTFTPLAFVLLPNILFPKKNPLEDLVLPPRPFTTLEIISSLDHVFSKDREKTWLQDFVCPSCKTLSKEILQVWLQPCDWRRIHYREHTHTDCFPYSRQQGCSKVPNSELNTKGLMICLSFFHDEIHYILWNW